MSTEILLALDGSSFCEAATSVAIQLAKQTDDARILAVHVVNVREATGSLLNDLTGHLGFEPAVVSSEVNAEHHHRATALLGAFAKRAEAEEVAYSTKVVVGPVGASLTQLSDSADLLIMGLRGETEDRFQGQGGALSSGFADGLDCSLMMVTQQTTRLQRIAVGYDGSEGARHAVRAIRRYLKGLGAEVFAYYVQSEDTEEPQRAEAVLAELDDALAGFTLHKKTILGDKPHLALINAGQADGCQLLALGFRGDHPIKDLIFGSVTDDVLLNQSVSVLISR